MGCPHRKFLMFFLEMCLILAVIVIAGCGRVHPGGSSFDTAGDTVCISVLHVGQADAALIQYRGKNMMIDTGDVDSRASLIKQLQERRVKEIESIIITHPHGDHLGGMSALFKNFKIHQIYDNGVSSNNAMYRNYLKHIKEYNISRSVLRKGDIVVLGEGIRFEVLSPRNTLISTENTENETRNGAANDNSIVCRLTYKNFSMLFMGDAQKEAEKRLLADYGSHLKSDVLKVGHHGSKTSSSVTFIKTVRPMAAIISCGAGNRYNFPHTETLQILKKESVQIFRIDRDGIVTIYSDGVKFNAEKEH